MSSKGLPDPTTPGAYITIYQCHGWATVCVDRVGSDGLLSGRRVLGGKCCPGQYSNLIAFWKLDEATIEELHEEMVSALEMAEEEVSGE